MDRPGEKVLSSPFPALTWGSIQVRIFTFRSFLAYADFRPDKGHGRLIPPLRFVGEELPHTTSGLQDKGGLEAPTNGVKTTPNSQSRGQPRSFRET